MSRETVERSIDNSICFGAYEGDEQIGFARVITDGATVGYLGDVFVVDGHRGKGVGKELMRAVLAHEATQGLRRFVLATVDAHTLYEQFGFRPLHDPERWMEL